MFHVSRDTLTRRNTVLLMLHPVGFNIRTALNDTVIPTGGGPAGKGCIDVSKGTHVGTSTFSSFR